MCCPLIGSRAALYLWVPNASETTTPKSTPFDPTVAVPVVFRSPLPGEQQPDLVSWLCYHLSKLSVLFSPHDTETHAVVRKCTRLSSLAMVVRVIKCNMTTTLIRVLWEKEVGCLDIVGYTVENDQRFGMHRFYNFTALHIVPLERNSSWQRLRAHRTIAHVGGVTVLRRRLCVATGELSALFYFCASVEPSMLA